jgi:hypothetical protein
MVLHLELNLLFDAEFKSPECPSARAGGGGQPQMVVAVDHHYHYPLSLTHRFIVVTMISGKLDDGAKPAARW